MFQPPCNGCVVCGCVGVGVGLSVGVNVRVCVHAWRVWGLPSVSWCKMHLFLAVVQ